MQTRTLDDAANIARGVAAVRRWLQKAGDGLAATLRANLTQGRRGRSGGQSHAEKITEKNYDGL